MLSHPMNFHPSAGRCFVIWTGIISRKTFVIQIWQFSVGWCVKVFLPLHYCHCVCPTLLLQSRWRFFKPQWLFNSAKIPNWKWHKKVSEVTLWHCDIGKIVGPSSQLWVTRATPVASTVTVNRTLIPKSPSLTSLTTFIIIFPRGLHFQILCNVHLWELQNFLFSFTFKKMFTFTFLRFAASRRRIPWADFDLLHSSLEASVQLWPSSIFGNIVTSLSLRSIKHWDQGRSRDRSSITYFMSQVPTWANVWKFHLAGRGFPCLRQHGQSIMGRVNTSFALP